MEAPLIRAFEDLREQGYPGRAGPAHCELSHMPSDNTPGGSHEPFADPTPSGPRIGASTPDVEHKRNRPSPKGSGLTEKGQLPWRATISGNGRSERIRTSDPLLPKQVRYQAALHSDPVGCLIWLSGVCNADFGARRGNAGPWLESLSRYRCRRPAERAVQPPAPLIRAASRSARRPPPQGMRLRGRRGGSRRSRHARRAATGEGQRG